MQEPEDITTLSTSGQIHYIASDDGDFNGIGDIHIIPEDDVLEFGQGKPKDIEDKPEYWTDTQWVKVKDTESKLGHTYICYFDIIKIQG